MSDKNQLADTESNSTNSQTPQENEGGLQGLQGGLQQGLTEPNISPQAMKVLRLLANDDYTPKQIAQHLNISRQIVYKHIRTLSKNKLYDPKKKGLTTGAYNYLGSGKVSKKFRSHAYECYYLLPDNVDKQVWKSKRGIVLTANNLKWDEVKLTSKQGNIQDTGCRFYLQEQQAIAFANGVYVWFPPEIADTPSDAASLQVQKIVEYGKRLSEIFRGIDFIKDNRLNVQVRKSEIAHMRDLVAHELRVEEKKLYVKVGKELRVICDFSNNIDEWETVSVAHGVTDHHALETHKDDIAQHGDLRQFTQDLVRNGDPETYVRDIIQHKPEEMPGVQNGIFLPSEIVRMFGEQARHNAVLSTNLTKLGELMAKQTEHLAKQGEHIVSFGQKVDKYGQDIDKHLEMVDSVTALATTMAAQSRASTDLVNQLSTVVGRFSNTRLRRRKPSVQRILTDYGGD